MELWNQIYAGWHPPPPAVADAVVVAAGGAEVDEAKVDVGVGVGVGMDGGGGPMLKHFTHSVILGTSGIGKSMFLYYVMWKLRLLHPNNLLIVMECEGGNTRIAFGTDGEGKGLVDYGRNENEFFRPLLEEGPTDRYQHFYYICVHTFPEMNPFRHRDIRVLQESAVPESKWQYKQPHCIAYHMNIWSWNEN